MKPQATIAAFAALLGLAFAPPPAGAVDTIYSEQGKLIRAGGNEGQVSHFPFDTPGQPLRLACVFLPLSSVLTNPIGRFGGSGGVISSRTASNTCFN